ncbi:malonate decarboxylase holo-ACP synthase [Companilactobacillus alimentarius]|uniref:malonate decarboxylase holo-ACP synthase n=1 Tax=Companilactobacillus alimentarius TaxID=1602 RepID=UPI0028B435FB|nr:malonate decarboxylase holo-ACP synthase [Companilactobacillus alimentarius]MDT6953466.1 malonate decarboxylase holo-ACP synthase [Companilactobacillus alimentarius]
MVEIHPHDLLKIDSVASLTDGLSDWADKSFLESLTVVVRRSPIVDNQIPVGIRGMKREQRFATFVNSENVVRVITPYELVKGKCWVNVSSDRQDIPAIKALPVVSKILKDFKWGISGSVGFELATATKTSKMTSDLDLVWLPQEPLSKESAKNLLKKLNQFGVHVDLQVIRNNNGFSLEEYANSGSTIMMKTLGDPILVKNPWI